jgi:hypothetical protein
MANRETPKPSRATFSGIGNTICRRVEHANHSIFHCAHRFYIVCNRIPYNIRHLGFVK